MAAPILVPLGTSANFAILAGSGISSINSTVITGNIGLSPAAGSLITGLTCGQVIGTIYDVDGTFPGACEVMDPGLLTIAKNDLTAAYLYLEALTPDTNLSGQDLGGMTLPPGVYFFSSSALLTGSLLLDGAGIYVFQIGSTLTTSFNSSVLLSNGALAGNIFWQIGSSATLATGTDLLGNVLALTTISLNNGATVDGRLLARNGEVTMNDNTINVPDTMYKIQVNYTPQTTGCHNICYGQTIPSVDIPCCLVDNTISTPGVPKVYYIDVAAVPCDSVSPVGPDPGTYTYDGYVQPCCAPGITLQVPWTATVDFEIPVP